MCVWVNTLLPQTKQCESSEKAATLLSLQNSTKPLVLVPAEGMPRESRERSQEVNERNRYRRSSPNSCVCHTNQQTGAIRRQLGEGPSRLRNLSYQPDACPTHSTQL